MTYAIQFVYYLPFPTLPAALLPYQDTILTFVEKFRDQVEEGRVYFLIVDDPDIRIRLSLTQAVIGGRIWIDK